MVEKQNEIGYQFTAVPTNLFLCMDNNCRSMLFTLIQLSTYYADKESGYFFRTNADLQAETNLSENLVRATLSSLFANKLIEVSTVGKSKGTIPNHFKVNFGRFAEWDRLSIEDAMKNPTYKIETADYRLKGFTPSYLKNKDKSSEQDNIDVIDEIVEEHTKPLMKQTVMEVAKAVMQERSQNEHNIENIKNEDNNSMSVNNSSDMSNTKNMSERFKEYKKQEDYVMDKLYKAKCWSDFVLYRSEMNNLIEKNPISKWNEKTKKRYRSIEEGKLKFFAKKLSNEPYNPVAEEVYKRTNCGWNNLELIQDEEFLEKEDCSKSKSMDDEWFEFCEKMHNKAKQDNTFFQEQNLPF